MTGSIAIDVALGLCFVFLLYSLLATIIQEFIMRILSLRARMLVKAVSRMLDQSDEIAGNKLADFFLEAGRNLARFFDDSFRNRPVTKRFYTHPIIKYLGESAWNRKPSYLAASTFSQTLIDLLRGPDYDGSQDQMKLIRDSIYNNSIFAAKCDADCQLRMFLAESKGDVEKFRAHLEKWFNETMERCTGWFKKQTQFILLILGFVLAVIFNIDAVAISRILSTDTNAREQLVQLATQSQAKLNPENFRADTSATEEQQKEAMERAYKEVTASIDESASVLGLGWDGSMRAYQSSGWSMFAGWLLTAFAISLGAPFWFDLLNKVMMLRASVRTEEVAGKKGSSISADQRVG